jgi:Ca2+/Na+ antiporter
MNNATVMLFNAIVLIVLGFISYFNSDVKSGTALIAPAIGIVLLFLSFPVKKDSRVAAHIGVVLTFLVAAALVVPVARTGSPYALAMCIMSFVCFFYYISSFVKRKRERESGE